MARVTNRFYIKSIHDGSTVFAEMLSNNPEGGFVQQVDSNGVTCDPNWNEGETGAISPLPILYPHVKLNGQSKNCLGFVRNNDQIVTGSDKGWNWNGAPVVWTTVGSKKYCQVSVNGNTVNVFELIESYTPTGETYTVPALKIIHNLAGLNGNVDNDIITFDGATEEDGHQTTFSVGQAIRITQFTGSGFTANIYGSNTITTANKTAVVYAQLFNGSLANPEAHTAYTTKWFREGIDNGTTPYKTGTGTANATPVTPSGNTDAVSVRAKSHYITVPEADVQDRVVLRCEFYVDGVWKLSKWFEIDDQVDEEVMYIACDSTDYISKDYIELHENQTARIKAWMATEANDTVEYSKGNSKYNQFWCKLYDQENNVLTTGTPFTGLDMDNVPTSPTYQYYDITKSGSDAKVYKDKTNTTLLVNPDYCGEISIDYSFVDSAQYGKGGVSGYVTALMTTNA